MVDLSEKPALPPETIEMDAYQVLLAWRLWLDQTQGLLRLTSGFVTHYGQLAADKALGNKASHLQAAHEKLRALLRAYSDNKIEEPALKEQGKAVIV